MDPNLLNLNSSLNPNDIQLLNQLLGSANPNSNKKAIGMSAKERNNLISKLSSNTSLEKIPIKKLEEMNESEKKIYREELRQRLKNKQKILRTSNLSKKNTKNNNNYAEAISKITDMMKNIEPANLQQLAQSEQLTQSEKSNNYKQESIINKIINSQDCMENNELENLDDYIN